MSRRALLALASGSGGGIVTPPPDPDPDPVVEPGQWTVAVSDPETATLGYSIPTTSPYNVPNVMPLPVAGNGESVHPSVVDFFPNTWNGHRYWMGITSYTGGTNRYENPHIFHSDDGYEWTLPAGVSAPLIGSPGSVETPDQPFNADTELVYDAANNTLNLFYKVTREDSPAFEEIWRTTSTNGSTWTTPALAIAAPGAYAVIISPTIVKVPGGWRMFAILGQTGGTLRYWNATTLAGPWAIGGTCTITGSTNTIWHVAAIRYGTRLYMAADGYGSQGVYPMISDDYGVTWKAGADIITGGVNDWDGIPYRTCLFLHPELDRFRVWYSAVGGTGWRTGYTHAPKSLWDSLA